MNSLLTTLERPVSSLNVIPVFAQNGFTCTLLALEPGAKTILPSSDSPDEQLLFVIDGSLAIQAGAMTTIVERGHAFLLPVSHEPVVSTVGAAPVRALRVKIPPRRIIIPQIITPAG